MIKTDREALERIAHILETAQVRWEGDTVLAYISAVVTAALARSHAAVDQGDK
jgi:hypothetical protein